VLVNPIIFVIAVIFIICMLVYQSQDIETFKFYIKEKEKDMLKSIHRLNDNISTLKEDNAQLSKRKKK
jgi:hypothetical protein